MIYIVNLSGGLTSFEALDRTIEQHGRANTVPVFADTRIEDPDLYRFLDDQERYLQIEIVRVADGRTPFDVWHDKRAITLRGPGAGIALCSQILKREVINRWIAEQHYAEYTLVFGMDWSEIDRMQRMRDFYAPIPVWFPLAEPPYVDKCDIAAKLDRIGIAVPALYLEGFTHNNCGGGCVKAGQAHWARLYATRPETYARWEAEENKLREYLQKDVSILVDRRGGGPRKSQTLAAFRERLDRGEVYDSLDWGGCGCFAPVEQLRMSDLLLDAEPSGIESSDRK